MNLEVDTFALIAQHANIYERGRANIADLDAEEKVVFDQLVSAVVSHLYSGFAQYQAGISSESDWKTYLTDWSTTYIKHPGFQSGWAEVRKSYPEDFCKCLDEVGKVAEDAN